MPSEKILEQKKEMVTQLAEKLKAAVSIVLVDYKGINVADDTALRSEMRENGVDYFVTKNSLLKYACEQAGFDEFIPQLEQSTALAISNDNAISPTKVLQKYSDKLGAVFNAKIGYIDGVYMTPEKIKSIARLPSREVLVSQVAGSLNGIIAAFARAVSEIAKKQDAA